MERKDDWVPVEEELPECDSKEYKSHYYDAGGVITSRQVLVTVQGKFNKFVTIGRYAFDFYGAKGRWIVANSKGKVIAWKDKPIPYEEGK